MSNFLTKKISFDLSREDSVLLRGLAITVIFIHNFVHLHSPILENETMCNLSRSYMWLANFLDGTNHVLLNIFSFWGHYGVPIFLFLSGYGLVKKFESSKSKPLHFWPFIKRNYFKLWILLFWAIVVNTIIYSEWNKWVPIHFTFLGNLIPGSKQVYGVWWFFSLIVQFYFLYALCFYKKSIKAPYIATFLSIVLLVGLTLFDATESTFYYVRNNFCGWILPFAMGVIMARHKVQMPLWVCLVSLVLFVLGEFNEYLWILNGGLVCLFVIPLAKIRGRWIRKPFIFMGGISASIFVLHPIIRHAINMLPEYMGDTTSTLYIILALYIVSVIIIAYYYQKFVALQDKWFLK